MADWKRVTRDAVVAAVHEYDQVGQAEFLARHGFGPATGYLLEHEGNLYDSKAIAGVAYELATGESLSSEDFRGGKAGAAAVLRRLEFAVQSPEPTGPAAARRPGTHWADDESPVAFADAQALWADAARDRLIAVAGVYHAITTYKELSKQVQDDSGVRTTQLMHYWIGDVLGLVALDCARREEPLLSSLCVNAEGSVGPGYAPSVASLRGAEPKDAEDHAALERLACYKHFGATIPAGGGRPALTPAVQRRKDRAAAQRPERRGAVCPTCFVELPVTGRCMLCG
jgi:hypothetical protein